ncbi:hypothetical protein HNR00_004026 [Methylorubrum rhodinum]|uniref:Uncharacterized protein n=1 Tax=Methylorubrum rhodinum TaxID=29428 RepID=A0A840ZQ62_9HYPH|nr:hypothetical protein [Methylorubrum rhodinum]MBB5759294.1 hypothetical protein [Methylorubrum rhodinum]
MADDSRDTVLAAMLAVHRAAEPLRDVMQRPCFPRGKDGSVAVWALGGDFTLSAEQVATLSGAFDLFCLAMAQPASEAIH